MLNYILAEVKHAIATPELQYTALIFALFVFPRFLIRWGIPFALTAFAMGFVSTTVGLEVSSNEVVRLLASLGIVALFLFAGLDVEIGELKENKVGLWQHIFIYVGILIAAAFAMGHWLDLEFRPATLLCLAVLTPSVGFILDSLDASKVPGPSKFWIRSKAISSEIVALFMMFVLIRSMSMKEFIFSSIGLTALILALPLAFRFFAKRVDPVAPKSEFGFLLMTALLSGMITKKLGAYYLIGAFVVGIVARRFESTMPTLTSRTMLRSLKFFAGFFTPFYFFHAGSMVVSSELTWSALLIGLGLIFLFLPIRIYSVVIHRRLLFGEKSSESFPVATSLLPNLVFGLVLADLLRTAFQVPGPIVGAVIIYTIGATLAPPILLRYFWNAPEYAFMGDDVEVSFSPPAWEEPSKNTQG